jgi:hypothetical protein
MDRIRGQLYRQGTAGARPANPSAYYLSDWIITRCADRRRDRFPLTAEGFNAQLTSFPTDLYSFPFYAPGLNCSSGVRRKTRVSLA